MVFVLAIRLPGDVDPQGWPIQRTRVVEDPVSSGAGYTHPETPERLIAIYDVDNLIWPEIHRSTRGTPRGVERVQALLHRFHAQTAKIDDDILDSDGATADTYDTARLAAGGSDP
jgi:hypothetical protein